VAEITMACSVLLGNLKTAYGDLGGPAIKIIIIIFTSFNDTIRTSSEMHRMDGWWFI
jgi:hypothetical protein